MHLLIDLHNKYLLTLFLKGNFFLIANLFEISNSPKNILKRWSQHTFEVEIILYFVMAGGL